MDVEHVMEKRQVLEVAQVLVNRQLLPQYWQMELAAPSLAAQARAGQFVMVQVGPAAEPLLRRPMGLNHIDREEGVLGFIYQVVGKGTRLLTQVPAGSPLSLTGPWGNGWSWSPLPHKVALVGGGAGIAPLLPLAQELEQAGCQMDIYLGASNRQRLFNDEIMGKLGNLWIATLDGSVGRPGPVDHYLPHFAQYDAIYTCGPKPMMKKVAAWAQSRDIPCQVSMEERMGCGLGTCMGCVCTCKNETGEEYYRRICREGPVFDSREVVFS